MLFKIHKNNYGLLGTGTEEDGVGGVCVCVLGGGGGAEGYENPAPSPVFPELKSRPGLLSLISPRFVRM